MDPHQSKGLRINSEIARGDSYREIGFSGKPYSSQNNEYTQRIEVGADQKVDVSKFKNQVSSFLAIDPDLLDLPEFDFGNKPFNWSSFANDLSIFTGFMPKNKVLLRKYINIKCSEGELDAESPNDKIEMTSPNTGNPKKKKLTSEEWREKRRKEKTYSYENFVERKNEKQGIKDARERLYRQQKLRAHMQTQARLRYFQTKRQNKTLQQLVSENDFIHHYNFHKDFSFSFSSQSYDPFEIFNDEESLPTSVDLPRTANNLQGSSNIYEATSRDRLTDRNRTHDSFKQGGLSPSRIRQKVQKELTEVEKNPYFKVFRRKSDSSLYTGGISKLEVKTQNLIVESVRSKDIREKLHDLSKSQHHEGNCSIEQGKLGDKLKTRKIDRSGSVVLKKKSADLRVPLGNPTLKQKKRKNSQRSFGLHTNNNHSIPSVNESFDSSSFSERDDRAMENGSSNVNQMDLPIVTLTSIRNDNTTPQSTGSQLTLRTGALNDLTRLLVNNQQVAGVSPVNKSPERSDKSEILRRRVSDDSYAPNNFSFRKPNLTILRNPGTIREVDSFANSPITISHSHRHYTSPTKTEKISPALIKKLAKPITLSKTKQANKTNKKISSFAPATTNNHQSQIPFPQKGPLDEKISLPILYSPKGLKALTEGDEFITPQKNKNTSFHSKMNSVRVLMSSPSPVANQKNMMRLNTSKSFDKSMETQILKLYSPRHKNHDSNSNSSPSLNISKVPTLSPTPTPLANALIQSRVLTKTPRSERHINRNFTSLSSFQNPINSRKASMVETKSTAKEERSKNHIETLKTVYNKS